MPTFAASDWPDIERLRRGLTERPATSVRVAAQGFAEDIQRTFSSAVLVRVFVVVPFGDLPPKESAFAAALAKDATALSPSTRVLSLLGTAGRARRERDSGARLRQEVFRAERLWNGRRVREWNARRGGRLLRREDRSADRGAVSEADQ